MLAARVRPFFDSLERDTVMVSHGGVARVLIQMLGGAAIEVAPGYDIHQGKVLVFGKGRWDWR